MKNYISFAFAFISIFTFALSPFVGAKSAEAAWITAETVSATDVPAWIYIPAINLFSYVEGVGIDSAGRMDVPSGKTNNVGWYKYGVRPGETGTAVVDAHNTAAFKNLHQVPLGSDIYVITTQGRMLHFQVQEAETHSMSYLKPEMLFETTNDKQLNLITCAGTLFGNGNATHRLIVSARLVG